MAGQLLARAGADVSSLRVDRHHYHHHHHHQPALLSAAAHPATAVVGLVAAAAAGDEGGSQQAVWWQGSWQQAEQQEWGHGASCGRLGSCSLASFPETRASFCVGLLYIRSS